MATFRPGQVWVCRIWPSESNNEYSGVKARLVVVLRVSGKRGNIVTCLPITSTFYGPDKSLMVSSNQPGALIVTRKLPAEPSYVTVNSPMTFDGNLRMGGRSVFSYPYGGASSFTAESFEQIKSLFRSWFCPLETRAEPLGPRVPLRPQGFKAPSKEEGQLEPIETMTEEEIAEMLKDMERERLLALSEAGLADADKAVAPVSSSSAKVWEIDPEPIETMTEEETAEMLKDMERERLLALSEAGLADADKAVAPVSSSSLTMCELDPELIQTMTEEETAEMLKDMERERLLALSEASLADADKAVAPVSSSSLTMCELDPELIQTMTEEETAEMLKDMERERLSAVGKVETAEVGKAVASDHRVYSFSLKRPELLSDDELDYIARMKSEDFMVKFNIAEDNVRPYMSSIQYEVTRRISGC